MMLAVWMTDRGLLVVDRDGTWWGGALFDVPVSGVEPRRYIGPWSGEKRPPEAHVNGSVWRVGRRLLVDRKNDLTDRGYLYVGPFDRNAPGRPTRRMKPRVSKTVGGDAAP